MSDVRWETSDRGFRWYALAEGHAVRESSAAEGPHLWVDDEHMTVVEATALRDTLTPGHWRDTLTTAIDGHYQTRTSTADSWKAGDPCSLCGSTDTTLEDGLAACNGCGVKESPASPVEEGTGGENA